MASPVLVAPGDTLGLGVLAVLGYHKIGEPAPGGWETWYYVPEATFVSQLRYLGSEGWQIIDAETFLEGLESPTRLPERAALVTFDDGYRSLVSRVLPLMGELRLPAVAFIPTAYVGGLNRWGTSEPEERICSWDELRELERGGISIQSHGVTHAAFSELEPDGLRSELVRSKQALEDELGKAVDLFAYPYGDDGARGRVQPELERAGYRAAFIYGGGPVTPSAKDRYRIERLPIGRDTDLAAELVT